jgi:hypothetical protein
LTRLCHNPKLPVPSNFITLNFIEDVPTLAITELALIPIVVTVQNNDE